MVGLLQGQKIAGVFDSLQGGLELSQLSKVGVIEQKSFDLFAAKWRYNSQGSVLVSEIGRPDYHSSIFQRGMSILGLSLPGSPTREKSPPSSATK